MFSPLQQVYIDSLKKQLEEANEAIRETEEFLALFPNVHSDNANWYIKRQCEILNNYKKKYNILHLRLL